MKNYIDTVTKEIYAYESDGSQDAYIPSNLTAITQAEADAILNPPKTIAELKEIQIGTLKQAYQAAIQLPVSYMTTTFQADSASQDLLTRSLTSGSVPTGFYWLDSTNSQVTMTFAQLQGLAGVMLAQGQRAFDKLQTLKAAVNSATSPLAISAVIF
jgi:hypothetical protein